MCTDGGRSEVCGESEGVFDAATILDNKFVAWATIIREKSRLYDGF